MDKLQFYPTTAALAKKAWSLFRNRSFSRVLDPSAGDGALLQGRPAYGSHRDTLDAIEIDGSKHDVLRARGIKVVGLDFERFQSTSCYSHVVMNPPFAKGCAHVLHAWNTLFDGEIVAIINAETLRNPFSKERALLNSIIQQHGCVEYVQDAFNGPDSARSTDVEIALVYLRKTAVSSDILGDIVGDLKKDQFEETDVAADLPLMIPEGFVENVVLTFNAAVESMRQAAHASVRASYYASLLGSTMASRGTDINDKDAPASVRTLISERYDELKDRAWANVLHSTQVREKLSTGARKRLESEFKNIKQLEFTVSNVYGFLAGLCNSGWDLQLEMACEVFDLVTRYHSENTVHYMGWKSNNRHRECGMRMRTTRFVLPGHGVESYSSSLDHKSEQELGDMDKVFAMLDGKTSPEVSLVQIFRSHFSALRAGERVSSSYFDVRYYNKGTIHFFARNKDLVDRLNRLVGQHRQWLPPATEDVPKGFWEQYDSAEKFDAEIRQAFSEIEGHGSRFSKDSIDDAFNPHRDRHEGAHAKLSQAISTVLHRHNIEVGPGLENGHRSTLAIESSAASA